MDIGILITQLDTLLTDYEAMKSQSKHRDLSDLPTQNLESLISRAIAAIHRISGNNSSYSKNVERVVTRDPEYWIHMPSIMGIAKALLSDLKSGCIQSLVDIAHADVFSDFLEMAHHLLGSKYKDAAAVIAGSTLESHLRKLCDKAGIPTETTKTNGDMIPKKADLMNTELTSSGCYNKLDQKNVIAWLDLRNKAAHGQYDEYTAEQVALLITGIRDFITRYPA